MRVFKNPELKGILALVGIALVLAFVLLTLTGTITDWFPGFRLTLKKPLKDKIVFISDRNGCPNVWMMKPDGSDPKALTNGKFEDSDPVVSPDGYTIVFISNRGAAHSQIYATDADGTHPRRLTNMTGAKSAPRFSSNGRSIIFLCAGQVWQMGSRGDRPERVLPTEREAAAGRFGEEKTPYVWAGRSGKGDLLAAVHSLGESQVAVWLKPGEELPQPIVHQLGQGAIPLAGEVASAAWAPGDEKLAVALNGQEGDGVLVVADLEGQSVRPVISGGPMGAPDWSPNGSIAVELLKRTGQGEYASIGFLVADPSSKQPQIINGQAIRPRWSPDGKKIVFTRDKDIYSLDVESGKVVNLTKGKGNNSDPSWAPVSK